MDTRVRPAYDSVCAAGAVHQTSFTFQTATLLHSRGAMRPRFAGPSRDLREGVERREAPGVCATHPLEAGITYPPRAARRPRAPNDVGRCASRRSTVVTSLSAVPGPRSGQLSLCPLKVHF